MKPAPVVMYCILLMIAAPAAWPSDACSDRAVRTVANVTVSDGSEFRTESYFHSWDAAAIRHIDDNEQLIAIEGPLSWLRRDQHVEIATDGHARFALGHQFHAFLLHFEEIVDNFRPDAQIAFRGNTHRAMSGDHPYGGAVHLVRGEDSERPTGLLIEDPDSTIISVTFHDWRIAGEDALPYHVQIDDGERIFDYRFTEVDVAVESPLWFFATVPAPALDEVQVYRLHRKLLAAHCLGDAGLMAELSAPDTIIASRGELFRESRDAIRTQFSGVFQRLDYTGYFDLKPPTISVSQSGDLGWIAVNVRAVGSEIQSGDKFDDQWAWIMTVAKINGRWLHTGNASNLAN